MIVRSKLRLDHIDLLRMFVGWGARKGRLSLSSCGMCTKSELLKESEAQSPHIHEVVKPNQSTDQAVSDGKDLSVSDYYYENGLRKVYPYHHRHATFARDRFLGRPLIDVYHREFFLTPEYLAEAIEAGRIRVNGQKVPIDYYVDRQDLLTHSIHRHENPVLANPIEILDETDDVLVLNKPSSIPIHASGGYFLNTIHSILKKEHGYPNILTVFRLDRLTSGVLIFGKSADAVRKIRRQARSKTVHKEYLCRVVGKFPDGQVTVDQPLRKEYHRFSIITVGPGGKPSVTHFQRVSYNGTSSVVRCFLESGRTHQIRVHLQYLGFPILNDSFYNHTAWGPNRGKGGHYEVPLDQVSQVISSDYADNRAGGDNPVYQQVFQDSSVGDEVPLDVIRHLGGKASAGLGPRPRDPVSGLPGFDESKYVLQRDCPGCRKLSLDPPKKDLVMFLHAFKYEGPDWGYEAPLPDWAKPDWDREEDFARKSLCQHAV